MKALGFYKPGPKSEPPTFEYIDVDRPVPTGRNLLVEVRAVSVNPTDFRTRDAKDENDDSLTIVGRDVAGVVVETGEDCTVFKTGDEVFYAGTTIAPGGHSEVHLVDERLVGKKPKSLDFAEAAALPLTSLTAFEAYFDRLGISRRVEDNAGKSILIIGAAGGVGSIATQIAKQVGLTVIGTASRPETKEWAMEHGADYTINHMEPFELQLQSLGLGGVHYIFCLTNVDDHMSNMAKVILPQGKICSILPTQKPLDIALFSKSVTFAYELMYTRSMFHTDDMIVQHELLDELADWVDAGKVKTTMTERMSPINSSNLKQAYGKLMSGRTIGKIVLDGPIEP
ncbi:zinc-binding alcohol dehydrogenase family protein [Planomicrobium sp. CPCC 101079]|uniref:zinc-binding alcohol dehydrogenase family protein n=1 Tax=Planomicrobium sp. CPCC 101079 TaxID=2599618 RepID=UPI0011B7176F|nr:zinc-binding alcohol dehydrogenase family protein [Planomicrobium sp. CPCC 101079]TWT14363.1 zinc-binding alcohol dehydrogenase family protein [Planomicrobium sp. CPCC 101079]